MTELRLEFARTIAQEAGTLTLNYFDVPTLSVERKNDGTPVTEADKKAEELLRARIEQEYPEDAILGEEFPDKPGTSGYRWILDPIDGTKSFIHGVPFYSTLIGVEKNGESELGVIWIPALSVGVWAGKGLGAWQTLPHWQSDSTLNLTGCPTKSPRRTGFEQAAFRPVPAPNASLSEQYNLNPVIVPAKVSSTRNLSDATFLTSEVACFCENGRLDAYLELEKKTRLSRTWGDAYGYYLVATGRADLIIDAEMSPWDAGPFRTIFEEAGGYFSDWNGRSSIDSGDGFACNHELFSQVLEITRRFPKSA